MKYVVPFILIAILNNVSIAQNTAHSYTDIFGIERSVTEHEIISTENPSRLITLDAGFSFVVMFDFKIPANSEFPKEVFGKDIAAGERLVFADHNGGIIERLIIFQFEGFLPEYDFTYNYSFSNSDSIGGIPFRNNVWFYNEGEFIKQNPTGVAFKTRRLIQEKGLKYPDEIIMSRIVMVTNPERSHELIISYIETGKTNNLTLKNWEDGFYSEEFKNRFVQEIKFRAIAALTITPITN